MFSSKLHITKSGFKISISVIELISEAFISPGPLASRISFFVSSDELFKADEIFLSGTVKKIIPVSILDNHPVGSGRPGPITQKIMRLYLSLLENL